MSSIRSFLDAQSAAVGTCRAIAAAEPLPLLAVFQPVRVRLRWPTRPLSDPRRAAEVRELPLLERPASDPKNRASLHEYDWIGIRGQISERPVLLLGEAGSGKSTLLAWECLARTRAFLDRSLGPGTPPAKLPIQLRASDVATTHDARAGGPDPGDSLITRIADAAARRVAGASPEQRSALRAEIRTALDRGAASLLLDDYPTDPAVPDGSAIAAELRDLCSAHPGIEMVVTARFAPAPAPDVRPLVWRVFDVIEWRDQASARFVERALGVRAAPAPARRRARTLLGYRAIARMAEIPRALALLCDAAIAEPQAAPALLARRVVRCILAAEHATDEASPQVDRELALLEQIAIACLRGDEVASPARGAPTAALRAGLLEPSTIATQQTFVLQRGLASALAATALARDPQGVSEILARVRTSDRGWDLAVLAAGPLASASTARVERLVEGLLDDGLVPHGSRALPCAAQCAAEVQDLAPHLLRRLVGRILDTCEDLVAQGRAADGNVFSMSIVGLPLNETRHELALSPLTAMIGAAFRTFGIRPEVVPLRRRLAELLASDDATTRRRTADVLASAAHDGTFRRALLGLLRPEREGDEEVRRSAMQALARNARHDPLLCESMLRSLDPRHEPGVSMRSAAATIAAQGAPFDERIAAAAVAHLDATVEPSATVRSELLAALLSAFREFDALQPVLARCLESDPDPDVRLRAMSVLPLIDVDPPLVSLLVTHLEPEHEPSVDVRRSVPSALMRAAATDGKVRRALLRHLDSRRERDDDVRAAAAGALRFVAATDAAARAALIASSDAVLEPSDEVRGHAVTALGPAAAEHEDARLALGACLGAEREPCPMVRLGALSGLSDALGDDGRLRALLPPLLDEAREPDWNMRRTAVVVLGRGVHHDADARRMLLARLDVPDDLRPTVALGLAGVAATDEEVRARLLAMATGEDASEAQCRACVVHALGHAMEHADVRATLVRQLSPWRERDPLVRRTLARTLAPLAPSADDVRTALLDLLRPGHERDPAVRSALIQALRVEADATPAFARQLEGHIGDGDLPGGDLFEALFLTFDCTACRE